MERRELEVELREQTGKGPAKRMRNGDLVPAILYGPHMKSPISLALKTKDLTKVRQSGGANVLLTLKSQNAASINGKMALMKDHQMHPLNGKLLHVDLFEVRMDEEIKVSVKVLLTGKPLGVAEGGILQQVSRELEIRCLPTNVPEKIVVDVSALNVGDSIHVKEITLPEGVKVVGTVNYTIAAVVTPEEEVIAAPTVGPTEAAVAGAPVAAPGAAPAEGEKATVAAPGKEGDKKVDGKKPEAKKAEGKKPEGK